MAMLRTTESQRTDVVRQLDGFMNWALQYESIVVVTESEHAFGDITVPPGTRAILWAGGANAVTFALSDRGVSVYRSGDIADSSVPASTHAVRRSFR